jgi:hypothetical protein
MINRKSGFYKMKSNICAPSGFAGEEFVARKAARGAKQS